MFDITMYVLGECSAVCVFAIHPAPEIGALRGRMLRMWHVAPRKKNVSSFDTGGGKFEPDHSSKFPLSRRS